jgi:hypothetical protein
MNGDFNSMHVNFEVDSAVVLELQNILDILDVSNSLSPFRTF